MDTSRRTTTSVRLVGIALALVVGFAGPAIADRESAVTALTIYTDAVATQAEGPTPEMVDDVVRRLREALPPEHVTPLVVDRMMTTIDDPLASAALVMVLDELGLSRGALLAEAVDRLAHEQPEVRSGAAIYLGGFLLRAEVDMDTKLLLLELLEPAADHAALLAPSLLALQLLQHGRSTPSMIATIDRVLAIALPDPAARVEFGVPGLVMLARTDEGNLRGLAMLRMGEWKLATPEVVDVLLENVSYETDDAALAQRVRAVAAQTLGDLAPEVARLGPEIGFRAHRELIAAGANEADEDLRNLIIHVGTKLGEALGRTMAPSAPSARPTDRPDPS